ncbi:NADH:ubiquinone reductase (Na(+)-transporting) subunit B [Salibacter halophilus]|uniref:Na(+)-translocating NADH-quinone reductase subunit B n=1 Tax=Salibacter halophilus TaxID=1803916 RepID=A0A6N6MCX6_9FLAO|nr:NADH:ubiquinone reductase (Na(+)-transporting) subunit B [Salibacter halophilus]KAB1065258.1 NADH:ubiquinone reductase (Na(+)-transporting) subunit B [Salibacter halophilus]
MKALENFMRKMEPKKDGKLPLAHTIWDGTYTFLFTPAQTTKKGVHIRDGVDLKRTMFTVVIALIPALLFGIWNTGHQHYIALGMDSAPFWDKILFGAIKVLPLVIVSYAVGLGVEFLFAASKGHPIQEGFLVSGMLIPLCMPVEVPLWMVAVATIFAVVIGKEVFGGTGMNILNPALTARAFLFFAYPTKMSGDKVWVSTSTEAGQSVADGFTGATALGDLATTVGQPMGQNAEVVSKFGADGTYSLFNAFMGWIPGSVGETSALAILIGAAILLITGIGSWKIMFSFLVGGLVMGGIFNAFAVNDFMELNPLHHVLIGGFMFGMVFMATDPVSAAQTSMGKWIYGFLGGLFAIMIRVFNPAYPEGVMLAILFMNVMAPMIDHYVVQSNIKKRQKRAQVVAA